MVNEVLADYRIPTLSRERYLQIFDFPARLYWQRAGLDLDRVEFSKVSARFCRLFENHLSRARLQPGALDLLRLLRRAGLRQFLISNTEYAALARMTERYGVAGFFDAVQGMDTGLADGKLPAARLILERFCFDPARALLVGDTSHDAEVARELGAACVLLSAGHQAPGRLEDQGVPVVGSFREFTEQFATTLGV